MALLSRNKLPNLIFLLAITTVIFITYVLLTLTKTSILPNWSSSDELFCHSIRMQESLPDVSDNPPSVQKRNIFFLETSCNSYKNGKIFIKARQACAVESAARMNPTMDVHLLFASPGVIKDENSESDRLLQMLLSYPNIKLQHFDIERYVKDSPVDILWRTGEIKTSIYPMAHTSDILRLLTLWKFGGIYLDLDVVVIKSLDDFPQNFGGAESDKLIANGVIGFSKYGKGREYINECMEDISQNFDGKDWNYNGPKLISRNIFARCPDFDSNTLVRFGRCDEFRIFPPSAFYLIPYSKWEWFFDQNLTNIIEPYIEERSYLIHVWNKFSAKRNIPKTDVNVPYLRLASKYCPGVVQELDEYF